MNRDSVIRGTFKVRNGSDIGAVARTLQECGVTVKSVKGPNIRISYVPGTIKKEIPLYSLCADGLLRLKIKGEEDHKIEIQNDEGIVGCWSYGKEKYAIFEYFNYIDAMRSGNISRNDAFNLPNEYI